MVEYEVILKRHPGSNRQNVCIFRDEDRATALKEMRRYYNQNGFTVQERDGRFTVADILLVEKEPVVGAPAVRETPYSELFQY